MSNIFELRASFTKVDVKIPDSPTFFYYFLPITILIDLSIVNGKYLSHVLFYSSISLNANRQERYEKDRSRPWLERFSMWNWYIGKRTLFPSDPLSLISHSQGITEFPSYVYSYLNHKLYRSLCNGSKKIETKSPRGKLLENKDCRVRLFYAALSDRSTVSDLFLFFFFGAVRNIHWKIK